MIGFRLGFSGVLERDGVEADLHETFGANVRWDIPVAGYLLLGPLLQFGTWRPDQEGANWNYAFDLALFVRARIPVTTKSVNLQFWAGVPIGVSFDILGSDEASEPGPGLGWNVGALAGGAVHFTRKVGMFAEFGWLQHRITHATASGPDIDLRLAQYNFNVGLVLKN